MRQDRKLRLLGLGMALVVIAVPSVAGIHAAASPTSAHRAVRHAHRGVTHVNVRSQASINRYLRSIGVNPATAVVQKGLRNYAGPNCPGADWNCTSANAPVVQLADPN